MKRSPMRRARKNRRRHQNSRPHLNAELRAAYLLIYDYDEWRFHLGLSIDRNGNMLIERPGMKIEGTEQNPIDPNHLWSLGSRPDFEANLISIPRYSHDWFHRHLPEGRVVSVLCKLRKAASCGETFDIGKLDEAAGKSVLGVIDNYEFPFEEVQMKLWQEEVVQRLTKLKGGS